MTPDHYADIIRRAVLEEEHGPGVWAEFSALPRAVQIKWRTIAERVEREIREQNAKEAA